MVTREDKRSRSERRLMAKLATEERLARLLAMIPWIVAHHGPTVVDVCGRFDLTPAELAGDISLLYLCGLHPYTPDLLIEAEIRDKRVWVSYADYFSRPLRLTPIEGLGLLTAAQTLLAVPGTDLDGPLATGLAKLASSLGADDVLKVDLGDAAGEVIDTLRLGATDGTQVEIDYLSFSRNERTVRIIEPDHVFVTQGQWYVSGWCHLAHADRTFRIDRIANARVTQTPREHPPQSVPPELFNHAPSGGTATIQLAIDDAWVLEQYPVIVGGEPPSTIQLVVTDHPWLDRLALRLSHTSTISAGPDDWHGTNGAATRLLQRYERLEKADEEPSPNT
jgi:predicted DNA-binding transcriptional regulator YafY